MKKVIPEDSVLVPDNAERVFKGMIFDVYQWDQELFDGSGHRFEMLKRADTVSVIAIVDEQILVIDDEQPHLGIRKSFPGGRVDETDQSVEAAAQREVLEETGYAFKNWRIIKVTQPHRKIEWFVYVLLTWDVTETREPRLDAGEKITVHQLSFAEVKQLVLDKAGYLGESINIFDKIDNTEQLLSLPEFSGKTVDR